MLPSKKLTLCDLAVILVLIIAAVFISVMMYSRESGDSFTVNADGNVSTYPLSHNTELSLTSRGIEYTVKVENGGVRVESAGCRDEICVGKGKISRAGDSIVCVPGRLVITVNGGGEDDADFVVG